MNDSTCLSVQKLSPTSDMVEAGLDILYSSGTIETHLDSDAYLVAEIFQAMATVQARQLIAIDDSQYAS